MAAVLTLASLFTVGTKGRSSEGTRQGLIQEDWVLHFLPGRAGAARAIAGPVPHWYLMGQLKCLLEETG